MNLKRLSDAEVLSGAKKWAGHERAGLHGVLHHLYEVDRRRLYSSLKYPSLFAYAVAELKYAEDAAVRRISAMRLMRELPEIEGRILSGSLSLTNLGLARKLFKNKDHSRSEKAALLNSIDGKSTREAQKIVFAIAPELAKREVQFHDFDDVLKTKLEKVRGLLAHKEGDLSLVQLLHKLCDEKLSEDLPAASRVTAEVRASGDECSNCGSVHALEVDHIQPRALGGSNEPENLRLLCRSCNQRAAIQAFGVRTMDRYLKSPYVEYGLKLCANKLRDLRGQTMRNANSVTGHRGRDETLH